MRDNFFAFLKYYSKQGKVVRIFRGPPIYNLGFAQINQLFPFCPLALSFFLSMFIYVCILSFLSEPLEN